MQRLYLVSFARLMSLVSLRSRIGANLINLKKMRYVEKIICYILKLYVNDVVRGIV